MTPQFSWSIDGAHSGVENMAIDEALLEAGDGWLRFYTWSEPTLSLGYFQSHAARTEHPSSAGCPLVRRSTGGGAILHDRELTYSLIVPLDNPLARDTQGIYDLVHRVLTVVLAEYGVAVRLHGAPGGANPSVSPRSAETPPSICNLQLPICNLQFPSPGPEPFLCFQRRAAGDVLLGDFKIAGSAQRRRKRAILQHGSILLAASPRAPELPGIAELAGAVIEAEGLAQKLAAALRPEFDLQPRPSDLPPGLQPGIDRAIREKFGNPAWTERR